MANSKPKAKPAVQQPFLVADTKSCGTVAQQTELDAFLKSCTEVELVGITKLIQRMSTGACINGDGTMDAITQKPTTGGYRKSVHYIKAWLNSRPQPVRLA